MFQPREYPPCKNLLLFRGNLTVNLSGTSLRWLINNNFFAELLLARLLCYAITFLSITSVATFLPASCTILRNLSQILKFDYELTFEYIDFQWLNRFRQFSNKSQKTTDLATIHLTPSQHISFLPDLNKLSETGVLVCTTQTSSFWFVLSLANTKMDNERASIKTLRVSDDCSLQLHWPSDLINFGGQIVTENSSPSQSLKFSEMLM